MKTAQRFLLAPTYVQTVHWTGTQSFVYFTWTMFIYRSKHTHTHTAYDGKLAGLADQLVVDAFIFVFVMALRK